MSLMDINFNPDKRKLIEFGIAALIAGAAVSLLLYLFKGLAFKWVLPIFIAGFVIFTLSLVSVKITRMIYIGLAVITMPVGIAVSFIMLTIFYFLLLMPLGLIFRIAGRDILCRKFEPNAKSYWEKRHRADDSERYFHQF
jgi:ABC-type cobalamin transport system permease subunit